MPRIAVGGFQHETNTFAPTRATMDKFELATGWPGLTRGERLFDVVDGMNLPAQGAIEVLRDAGAFIVPLLWTNATPSAQVSEDAFERITAMMLEDLSAALEGGRLDGIYFDLHGAMVTDHHEDGEGAFLARVRAIVGAELPIAVSLDLHANLTEEMVRLADVIDIYRTYPHIDMSATGRRAAELLLDMLNAGGKPVKSFRRTDFLIPLNWGCTLTEPACGLYSRSLPDILEGTSGLGGLAFACGFPPSDIAEVGPGVVAYGNTQAAVGSATERMLAAINAVEAEFDGALWMPDAAVAEALRVKAEGARGPVLIADTQDNPGGGGPGDTTGMLRALVEADAAGAVLGLLVDPESAAAAHRTGTGNTLSLDLGGKTFPGDSPLRAEARVLALGDGDFMATGPMWGGSHMQLGRMALVEVPTRSGNGGVRVALCSVADQAGDKSMFRHLGVEPDNEAIMVLKSSVHFRADFQPSSAAVLVATAPGPVAADPATHAYHNIRAGVRLRPGRAGR